MNNNKLNLIFGAGLFTFIITFTFLNLTFNSIISITIFAIFSAKFYLELGEKIEIRDIIILIALLQWIIGPLLSYAYIKSDSFYYMVIPENEYMDYVFPASLLFIVGLYFPIGTKKINENEILAKIKDLLLKYPHLDLILVGSGLFAAWIKDSTPLSIRFAFYLLANMRFIGLFILLLGQRPYKWTIFSVIIFLFFSTTIQEGMFHDFILWGTFIFVVLAFILKFSHQTKILILSIMLFGVVIIQSVKHEFRKILWSTAQVDATSLFSKVVSERLSNDTYLMSESNTNAMISRINQGWIVARIMNYVPRFEPFAEGETIKKALIASLVPRLLMPNKVKAGGQENFERFTGHKLRGGTSMNLSILGEAYANYGIWGGSIFMFILGLFYNFIQLKIYNWTRFHPTLLLWIPLIFLQAVKAEGDFAISLNHIVKAGLVTWAVFYFLPKFFSVKL